MTVSVEQETFCCGSCRRSIVHRHDGSPFRYAAHVPYSGCLVTKNADGSTHDCGGRNFLVEDGGER